MSSYPEDHRISVEELIRVWIANGLIREVDSKSLEVSATEFLQDLVARSLVFMRETGMSGQECGIHDLFREVCLKEFNKEQFIGSPKVQYTNGSRSQCFLSAEETPHGGDATDYSLEFVLLSQSPSSPSSRVIHRSVCGACRVMYSHVEGARLEENDDQLASPHFTQVRF
ncbi:probable disease resistance RPP8-like protein 2 [Andrographis paniculata]|uniref:probable disease resistance RPP8-like protein 2 n=1 Tax=Andrographis paniculata TaxID=175694 RepID=UPI0021E86499|nr:probable disease resistance RPP8-like protein 2 [Andrographis paniculata]